MTITMSLPAIITIVIVAVNLVVALIMHGKPTKINFFVSLLSNAISVSILYWGGFFS